jgi:hypothetical protein
MPTKPPRKGTRPERPEEDSPPQSPLSVLESVTHHVRVAEAHAQAAMCALDQLPSIRDDDGREPRVIGRVFALIDGTLQAVSDALDLCERGLTKPVLRP